MPEAATTQLLINTLEFRHLRGSSSIRVTVEWMMLSDSKEKYVPVLLCTLQLFKDGPKWGGWAFMFCINMDGFDSRFNLTMIPPYNHSSKLKFLVTPLWHEFHDRVASHNRSYSGMPPNWLWTRRGEKRNPGTEETRQSWPHSLSIRFPGLRVILRHPPSPSLEESNLGEIASRKRLIVVVNDSRSDDLYGV